MTASFKRNKQRLQREGLETRGDALYELSEFHGSYQRIEDSTGTPAPTSTSARKQDET